MGKEQEHFWTITGPRKYLNIPTHSPNKWRAELTVWPVVGKSVDAVGWGGSLDSAMADALGKSEAILADREAAAPQRDMQEVGG